MSSRACSVSISIVTGESDRIGQGREQHTAGTGFVVHDQLSGVLDVDVLAERERADPAAHVGDRSEEPLHEVQGVDRLVHQHAPAAASPLATPRTAGVVLGSAVPGNRRRRAPDRAERPLVDQPVRLLRRPVVPVLEADRDLDGGVREVASSTGWASARVCATGFSRTTWTPRSMQSTATGACWSCGVQTWTTSGRRESSISR